MRCEHNVFECKARVARLTNAPDGPVTGYTADIAINCADCGLYFRFPGLAAGSSHDEPRVSFDGTELRAPIKPSYPPVYTPATKGEQQ